MLRFITTFYVTIVEAAVILMALKVYLEALAGTLPFRTWQPYSLTSPTMYWLTYLHHAILQVITPILNVGTDTLICGLMLQVCAQIDILIYRLSKMTQPTSHVSLEEDHFLKTTIDCIHHHTQIYK